MKRFRNRNGVFASRAVLSACVVALAGCERAVDGDDPAASVVSAAEQDATGGPTIPERPRNPKPRDGTGPSIPEGERPAGPLPPRGPATPDEEPGDGPAPDRQQATGQGLTEAQLWWVSRVAEMQFTDSGRECGQCKLSVPHALLHDEDLAEQAMQVMESKGIGFTPQIVCGAPTKGAYPAVAAIYQATGEGTELGQLLGTGTLAEGWRSVLTAQHVVDKIGDHGCVVVFDAEPMESAPDRRRLCTQEPEPHATLDLAVLTLQADAPSGVEPLDVGGKGLVREGEWVRAVGYGFDERGGRHVRKSVQILVANAPCDSDGRKEYGCKIDDEFVAAEPLAGCDTCDYDSGGPALVVIEGHTFVVGVLRDGVKINGTSACTRGSTSCGCGSIYVYADNALGLF